jgi:hypothetical protein
LLLFVLFTLATNTALGGFPSRPASVHDRDQPSPAATLIGSEAIQTNDGSGSDWKLRCRDHTCHLAQHFLGYPVAGQPASAAASRDRPTPLEKLSARSTDLSVPKRPPPKLL